MALCHQSLFRRLSLGLFLIFLSVGLVGGFMKTASKPHVSYDYLQEHIELTYTPIEHRWETPLSSAEPGRSLSGADHEFMSRILMTMERGQKIWAGQNIVEGNALQALEDQVDAWRKCQNGQGPCTLTVRLGRILTPLHVHGDLRVANIEERSHRIDLIAAPVSEGANPQFKVSKTVFEIRNLRFAKRRKGWALRTIDVLQSDLAETNSRASLSSEKFVGMNYYPAQASWRDFWTVFPNDDINRDLALISSLGGNSLRIFLTHSTFTNRQSAPQAKERLLEFMDMAHAQGLKVIPTLFDLRPDYRLENWASDAAYLKALLPLIKDHPALLAIDLKNQIDLDIPANGAGMITGWISVMSDTVRRDFPNIPITVGFSNSDAAILYGQDLDVISYHDYDPINKFSARLDAVRSAYPDRPVWITEMGTTVWQPIPFLKRAEKKQAARLARQLSSVARIEGVFIWTLSDFEHVGSDVVGWQPWRKKQQAHYGLYDLQGNARPSAEIFSQYARTVSKTSSRPHSVLARRSQSQTSKPFTLRGPQK